MVDAEQSNTARKPAPPFPIVAIGASAGGIRALQEFFSALPRKVGAAFVIVVHLDPEHHSELAELIALHTAMPVKQVSDAIALERDHVYVIPPNRRLYLSDQELHLAAFDEPRGRRAPIDQFFRSLAEQYADGFGIIMSGAGSDGALGVKAMKEAGAIILVQDPNEAEYSTMPRAAMTSGNPDFVLPLREMARQLTQLVRTKEYLKDKAPEGEEEEAISRILAHLRVRTGHDFSQYKRASLMRRIARRVQVARAESFNDYLNHLREHPEEVQALFSDLLISVTSFFRDASAYDQLAKTVIPAIFAAKEAGDPIRVWVPGCATGEEAYSIVFLLLEEAARREVRPEIQLFATDLDAHALSMAREGCYPATISTEVSDERLHRFFNLEGEEYRIKREVRDLIVFAIHNLLKDPPFSRLDLISCRNLLIYINRDLQQRVCSTFHYALLPEGYLFLGSSESAENPEGLFRAIDRQAKIYQSSGRLSGEPLAFPRLLPEIRPPDPFHVRWPPERSRAVELPQQHRQALAEFAPPSVLVDDMHRVLHISEKAGQYMNMPAGTPTYDAMELVRPELSAELSMALHRAFEQGQSSFSLPIPVQFNGHSRNVCVQVSPVANPGTQPRALVLFIEGGPADIPLERPGDAETSTTPGTQVKTLQEELAATRAHLKATRQQYETATENLRAANEELQSINEEYRSTAEELETSREELQSMNEELQTLNNELKIKLDAVSNAHNDLENLMITTDFATLLLDTDLRIKRFTPRICDLFNINPRDEGRRITDFTNQLHYSNFEQDMRAVLAHDSKIEREIRSTADRLYVMRMRPYRTTEGKATGVVVTFVDITQHRSTENQLRDASDQLHDTQRQLRHAEARLKDGS